MYLKTIHLLNFKNLVSVDLPFSSKINCFIGPNGAGKTNVIDAIHYLSLCKSSTGGSDHQCLRHGSELFMVEGIYDFGEDNEQKISCGYTSAGGKKVMRGGKEYQKLSQHIGVVPLVMVSPADGAIIHDAAEERRRYLNALISQIDPVYLDTLIKYNRLLQERNRLLKNEEAYSRRDLMEVYDVQLADYGTRIHARRREIVGELAPRVAEYYAALSGDREQVELRYSSKLNDRDFTDLLAEAFQKDAINGFTGVGIHRDDIRMSIMNHPINRYGSQGQQKSFIIALKLAQFDVIASRSGKRPLLLLDDIFDKLDPQRVGALIDLVSGDRFGQIFITDCNSLRLQHILDGIAGEYKLFGVSEGEVAENKAQGV